MIAYLVGYAAAAAFLVLAVAVLRPDLGAALPLARRRRVERVPGRTSGPRAYVTPDGTLVGLEIGEDAL